MSNWVLLLSFAITYKKKSLGQSTFHLEVAYVLHLCLWLLKLNELIHSKKTKSKKGNPLNLPLIVKSIWNV